jgi:hypothetical protein
VVQCGKDISEEFETPPECHNVELFCMMDIHYLQSKEIPVCATTNNF